MSMEPIELVREGKSELIRFDPLEHVQQPYIEKVIRSLQGIEKMDDTAASALLTQELLEAIDTGAAWQA